jgi:peptide/nickel transport system ATP-binding protein
MLSVERLNTVFDLPSGTAPAVIDVSLRVDAGETLCLVGESGSGKSVTALSIMRLVQPPGRIAGGSIVFKGRDLLSLDQRAMQKVRGGEIGLVFQEPMTALNPVFTVGNQIEETLAVHGIARGRAARQRAIELLESVSMPDAARRAREYSHQLSGGLRQRALIALALAGNPSLLIADEPTTALDVTIQAQILKLMIELKSRFGAAIMLITHDLGVVAETCQRVIVMYAGRKVEEAPVLELFDRPAHPYPRGLMASIPRRNARTARKKRLYEIPGMVPNLREPIVGCAFAPRCAFARDRCRMEAPPLREMSYGHVTACWEAEQVMAA